VPVYGVFGNNMGDIIALPKRLAKLKNYISLPMAALEGGKDLLEIRLADKNVVVYHGHDEGLLSHLLLAQQHDIILTGHTHKASVGKNNHTLVINPGATCFVKDGDSTNTASVAIYDTTKQEAVIREFHWKDI